MINIPGSKPLFATTLYEINVNHIEINKINNVNVNFLFLSLII